MKLRLSILLLAAALAASPAAGQTIKSLGYNTTNGDIVAATNVTFTNSVGFATNARAATRTNLGGTTVGNAVFTATNAAAAATAVGLGETNSVTFSQVTVTNTFYPPTFTSTNGFYGAGSLRMTGSTTNTRLVYRMLGATPADRTVLNAEDNLINLSSASVARTNLGLGATWLTNTDVTNFRTAIGLGATNNVSFNQLTATGNVTLNGSDNLMPNATNAASASSLMTRSLSDVRYLGEMWHAWRMSAYSTTNIPGSVFKSAPCVLYTNGQSSFYVEAFLEPSKYAGKTLRVLAYCRVDSTNGGNVQGSGRVVYLTNNAGGADPNFPLTVGGQKHGTIGAFTDVNTDVFPVATSTNQYLVFTSNVGTIPTNATMIVASFGFNRASTNTTFTNGNLYMQAVRVVVENP